MTFTLTSWPVSLQEKGALIMFEFGIFTILLKSSVESPLALVSNHSDGANQYNGFELVFTANSE